MPTIDDLACPPGDKSFPAGGTLDELVVRPCVGGYQACIKLVHGPRWAAVGVATTPGEALRRALSDLTTDEGIFG